MSNGGPSEFTDNELIKFEKIYEAEKSGKHKKAGQLKGELSPTEEDHYDDYFRLLMEKPSSKELIDAQTQRAKTFLQQHSHKSKNKDKATSSESHDSKEPGNRKKI